jgi:hypothetical protein
MIVTSQLISWLFLIHFILYPNFPLYTFTLLPTYIQNSYLAKIGYGMFAFYIFNGVASLVALVIPLAVIYLGNLSFNIQ